MASTSEPEQLKRTRRTVDEFFAEIPRKVVLHRIETGESLEDRLFWAVILWTCVPTQTEYATVRDRYGFISKVASTATPIPAKSNDFIQLLNLGPGAKGSVSRAFARLEAKGAIRRDEEGRIYPIKDPKLLTTTETSDEPGPRIFHIGTRAISSDVYKHLSPELQERLEDELESCSTAWKADLKKLRTSYASLLVQTLSDAGIIIELRETERKGTPSSSCPVQEQSTTTSTAPEPAPETPPAPEPPVEPNPPERIPTEEPAPAAQTDVQTITAAIGCDPDGARRLLRDTRQRRPDATAAEIVVAAFWKVRQLTGRREKIGNMIGMLIRAIPNMAEGDGWLEIRREVQRE